MAKAKMRTAKKTKDLRRVIAKLKERQMTAIMNNERNKEKLAQLYECVKEFQGRLMDIMTGKVTTTTPIETSGLRVRLAGAKDRKRRRRKS